MRKASLKARQSVAGADHAAWSRACCGRVVEFIRQMPHKASIVSGYVPIKGELDILPALEALAADYATALPVVMKKAGILAFRRFSIGDELATGALGTSEPLPEAKEVTPDVILVPLVAFDRRGHRLGYGAGYYDATLKHYTSAMTIGIGFASQEVNEIPEEAFDLPLAAVITEKEIIRLS